MGIWAYNESKLSNKIALRSEIGFDSRVWGGAIYDKTGFLMTPVITAEPRWYYNLDRRKNKSKNINGNSGNYVALRTNYHPNWFTISNYNNVTVRNSIAVIPTWGIRRNIGKHFNYETGVGIGYYHFFDNQVKYNRNNDIVTLNLHLRIGYRFLGNNI